MVQFFSQVLGNQRALSKKVQKPVQKWCRNGAEMVSLAFHLEGADDGMAGNGDAPFSY